MSAVKEAGTLQVYEVPDCPPVDGMLVVFIAKLSWRLTGDGADGLEVGGSAILQVDGDGARGVSPGEGK